MSENVLSTVESTPRDRLKVNIYAEAIFEALENAEEGILVNGARERSIGEGGPHRRPNRRGVTVACESDPVAPHYDYEGSARF
ncbi:unnamed protein product [Euphydryas editha]|uniref:Uncharacterized protein n=1 Tax=Euphydryas editha TaxID=104508 RepID=A0AAU9TFD9_EUPED|nr:unnamed protein product [Euphydryas editha]